MRTAKDEAQTLLDQLPDKATVEDIHYHIYVRQKIRRGLEDMEEDRVVSEEEAEKRMSKWLEG